MKDRINPTWKREELEAFLLQRYSCGLWEFEYSFSYFCFRSDDKKIKQRKKFLTERINKLESVKSKTIEMIDDLMIEIRFYHQFAMLSKGPFGITHEYMMKPIKWTRQKKIDFITENYKLKEFFSVLDQQIEKYNDRLESISDDFHFLKLFAPQVKPLTLLVLTWSNALKRGGKVDWINMNLLLEWFANKRGISEVLNFYKLKTKKIPTSEMLRFTRNKYLKSHQVIQCHAIYDAIFRLIGKEDIPFKIEHSLPLDEHSAYFEEQEKWTEYMGLLDDFSATDELLRKCLINEE